ncbi:hypothetical protein PISMIDRAFT_677725, partial [Pisolithus microcarpus 441]
MCRDVPETRQTLRPHVCIPPDIWAYLIQLRAHDLDSFIPCEPHSRPGITAT